MREIKFRGRRKVGTEWLIGDLNHIDGKVFIFPRTEDTPLNSPDWFEVLPETVGQYIGLKDKNSKEIYEGDVLYGFRKGSNLNRFYRSCVEWNTQQCGFILRSGKFLIEIISLAMEGIEESVNLSSFEIIGNIHANPELIK